MDNSFILLIALVLDALIGDPMAIYRHVPHPVVVIGNLIATLEQWLNRAPDQEKSSNMAGLVLIVGLLVLGVGIAIISQYGLNQVPFGWLIEALLISLFLAQKSLYQHVEAVAAGLEQGGVETGRFMVARIVGRDPQTLDEAGVARAAIESLAENFSDGVIAPALYGLFFGLPGIVFYKITNTADSMIGHKSPQYLHFGRAAAQLDDYVNWPASRLSAFLIVFACLFREKGAARKAWEVLWRDAHRHRSPNAGWPEAAMAGGLGLKLSGPRSYHGVLIDEPTIGDGREQLTAADIRRALNLYVAACAAFGLLVAGCFWIMTSAMA